MKICSLFKYSSHSEFPGSEENYTNSTMVYFSASAYQPTHSVLNEKFFLYFFKYKMLIFEHFKKPGKIHFMS